MPLYRLLPTPAQEAVLRDHCGHARYVWNLAVEQHAHWHPGRKGAPGYLEQCRQLTAARAGHPWLAAGLPDGAAAGAARLRPGDDGVLRPGEPGRAAVVAQGRAGRGIPDHRAARAAVGRAPRVSRNVGQVWVPKAGWVRFRWSRDVPPDAKSYRVTLDRAGRWHIAFAVSLQPVPAPRTGETVGIDRGVVITAALSTGEKLHCPRLTRRESARLRQGSSVRAARAMKGSHRNSRPSHARYRPAAGS